MNPVSLQNITFGHRTMEMEVFENSENKESDIQFANFPFICRICLRRGDLRLFEEEDCLLDLFMIITKIDVCSSVNFPRNICNVCVNKLEDISLFIDISKYNDSIQREVKTAKAAEDFEKDMHREVVEICRICSLTNFLTPFEEKTHLMQVFENITGIDVKSDSNLSSRNKICHKCINELENISLFISLSLCNNMKLKNSNGKNEALKIEDVSKGNTIDISSSKCCDIKFEGNENEVKMEDDFNKNGCSYESSNLHTIIDIKEGIDNNDACIEQTPRKRLRIFKNSFKCDYCDKTFSQKTHLREHMRIHTGERPFKCDYCQKRFTQNNVLKYHLLTHTREKPFKCDCCEKRFTRKNHFESHLLIHTGQEPFECDYCQKRFSQKNILKHHLIIHSAERPFKCNSCEKSFRYKCNLKRHSLSHTREKLFKCDCCENSYSLQSHLRKHMRTHTGEKILHCKSCEKSFTRPNHFKSHLLIHAGEEPFECDYCKKRFTQSNTFKCDLCKKTFIHKWRLKRHLLIHSGEKSNEGDCCENGYSQETDLQKHTGTRTEENPFGCDTSEKSLPRPFHLDEKILPTILDEVAPPRALPVPEQNLKLKYPNTNWHPPELRTMYDMVETARNKPLQSNLTYSQEPYSQPPMLSTLEPLLNFTVDSNNKPVFHSVPEKHFLDNYTIDNKIIKCNYQSLASDIVHEPDVVVEELAPSRVENRQWSKSSNSGPGSTGSDSYFIVCSSDDMESVTEVIYCSSDDPELVIEPSRKRTRTSDKRRVRKREQNRSAATRYRMKKKSLIDQISTEEKTLLDHKTKLEGKIADLELKVKYMKELVGDLLNAKGPID